MTLVGDHTGATAPAPTPPDPTWTTNAFRKAYFVNTRCFGDLRGPAFSGQPRFV